MIHKLRPLFLLLTIYLLLLSGGLLVIGNTDSELTPANYATLVTFMTMITLVIYLVVTAGFRRNETDQGIWLLAGLSGKFLAYLVIILIYWANGKNFTKDFIIAFFVLYLLLTIFLMSVLFKKLKNN